MTLQRGTPDGWEASGKERRKVASEPGGERTCRKGVPRKEVLGSRTRLVPVTGPKRLPSQGDGEKRWYRGLFALCA